jgi:DMSO reductase anchor subunit
MFALLVIAAVLTVGVIVHLVSRGHARRPALGSVSDSWLSEERASDSNRT